MACTVTIFGRPLAGMPQADADIARSYVADLDDCPACVAVKERRKIFSEASATQRCWHRYVTDNDGVEYCNRCGHCPAEIEAEHELREAENEAGL